MTIIDRGRRRTTLAARFGAFVAERHPFALEAALEAFEETLATGPDAAQGERGAEAIEVLREPLRQALRRRLSRSFPELPETTPGVSSAVRLERAAEALAEDCDGFLAREAITASLSADEKRELLRGMVLTRATDNRLKAFFAGGEVRYQGAGFQGKGFRSLGQEAIYAAPLRLRRGERYRASDGSWHGDVVAPVIRDLGAALAMHPEPETVRMVLNAQMAKAGPPMEGKDLHVGDFSRGILPATAPLSIATLNVAGLAFAFSRELPADGGFRVALSFIGEGGARSASGTRRSTSARPAGCPWSSASRTTAPPSRPRSRSSRRCGSSRTRRRATASPA